MYGFKKIKIGIIRETHSLATPAARESERKSLSVIIPSSGISVPSSVARIFDQDAVMNEENFLMIPLHSSRVRGLTI